MQLRGLDPFWRQAQVSKARFVATEDSNGWKLHRAWASLRHFNNDSTITPKEHIPSTQVFLVCPSGPDGKNALQIASNLALR